MRQELMAFNAINNDFTENAFAAKPAQKMEQSTLI